METLVVPKARAYGWDLKPLSSANYQVVRNKSDQICVVLEHSLLRGVTTEMIYWWFRHFPMLKVRLLDIPDYEQQVVPAYWLWHPSDHISAQLKGTLGPQGTSKVGVKIHIQEVMQYERYGLKYPVNQALTIFYHEQDGWCMGKKIPLVGFLMLLRISFKDVYENGEIIGVHYHYEVVAGSHKKNVLARALSNKIVGAFDSEFWEAWFTHNIIEVGVFENFLAPLYKQRDDLANLTYGKDMNPVKDDLSKLQGYNHALFEERVQGFERSVNGFEYLAGTARSFL